MQSNGDISIGNVGIDKWYSFGTLRAVETMRHGSPISVLFYKKETVSFHQNAWGHDILI